MTTTTEQPTTDCAHCGEPIYSWVHSQWGALKVRAWTHLEDVPDYSDPRDNVRCADAMTTATPAEDVDPAAFAWLYD